MKPDSVIRRIVSVRDTREYEEQHDKWVPIPGSGEENECARCGRLHEVHAEVELEGGARAVVGTGCMGAESLQTTARRGARSAQSVARLRAEVATWERRLEAYDAADAEVRAAPTPPVTIKRSGRGLVACCDGASSVTVWITQWQPDNSGLRAEMERSARERYRAAKVAQRTGYPRPRWYIADRLSAAQGRLKRAEARLERALS